MQRMQMRMKHDICYAQHFPKINSERCQASEVELFAKTVNDLKPLKAFITKGPPCVFDGVLGTYLASLSYTYERGRVLGVDPLYKKGFKLLVYIIFAFKLLYII